MRPLERAPPNAACVTFGSFYMRLMTQRRRLKKGDFERLMISQPHEQALRHCGRVVRSSSRPRGLRVLEACEGSVERELGERRKRKEGRRHTEMGHVLGERRERRRREA